MSNPLKQLGLPDDALPSQVRARWRELAAEHHPDKGGTVENFQLLEAAYKTALLYAKLPRTCEACQGSGRRYLGQGFTRLVKPCEACKGLGTRILE